MSQANAFGTFWLGQDGNVYVAGDSGVNNAGSWDSNTERYWSDRGYMRTSDPVSGTQNIAVPQQSPLTPIKSGTRGTGGTGSTGTTDIAQHNLLRQGLNTGIASLEGQLQVLDPQEQTAKLQVQNQYQTNTNRLMQDKARGDANLQVSRDQVNTGKERSLGNLRTWLQSQGMGYQNQLGAMGAGNSSASGLINFALGQQGARERGNILQDAGNQIQDIDMQGKDLEVSYQRSVEDLDTWKNTTLNEIVTSFQQARNQIQNSILDARARAAAEMELTQEAVSNLQQLQNQYSTQATDLATRYQNMLAPQKAIDPSLMQYAVQPVQQAQLNGMNMPTPVNPESGLTAYYKRRDDDLLANPLGA